jgi:hypothetical protein
VASGTTTDDSTYTRIEGFLQPLISNRDKLATQIATQLDAASSGGPPLSPISATVEIAQARFVLTIAQALATITANVH